MSFNIEFDYRFDTNGFFTAPARAALEETARIWEAIIKDEFPNFAAGQTVDLDNPQTGLSTTVTIDQEIDDLLIFVGARDLGGSLGLAGPSGGNVAGDENALRIANDFRGQGPTTDYEPFVGVATFDSNANWSFAINTAAPGQPDFISTALHEIGHVLGFSTTQTFDAFVNGASFNGPNALAANGGQPIPLVSATNGHVQDGFLNDVVLLDPTAKDGVRKLPSDIDKAILADIGYEIDGFTKQGTSFAIATEQAETIFGRDIADAINGLGGDDQIQGGNGDDSLQGGAGANVLFGQNGTDRFFFSPGDGESRIADFDFQNEKIVVDPAFGFTTAEQVLSRVSSPFSNVRDVDLGNGASAFILTNGTGSELTAANIEFGTLPSTPTSIGSNTVGTNGDDKLVGTDNAETIDGLAGNDFLVGSSLLDLSSTAGSQIYRVYQATLDRAPDTGGFEGWTNQLESGNQSLQQIITGFVGSTEFQNTYGSLNNTDFVTLLYNNVLDRGPDSGGLNGWVNAMNNGLPREQVVTGFSESVEFKDNTKVESSAYAEALGGRALSVVYDDVFRLYQATLDRAPDLAGLEGWSGQLAGGQPYTAVAAGFTGSAEFSAAYGNLDNGAFVDQLYRNVLDREADAGGRQGWVGLINNGGTREDVVQGFAQSDEFVNKTAGSFKAYMKATTGGDTLDGGAGNDTLYGGLTPDTFVFNAGEDGTDTVLQLDTWDTLQFEGFGYGSAANALAKMSAAGPRDVLFADQGVNIVFSGVDLATMQEVDYLFA